MRRKALFFVIPLIVCALPLFGLDDIELSNRIEMANITKSSAPVVRHRSVLFTYQQTAFARYVGIAFETEDFQIIHPFKRNQHGVYVFLFNPPEESGNLDYRIVVDGLWMPDPKNTDTVRDHRGNVLSRFTYSLPAKTVLESPRIASDGVVEFNMRYAEGTRVYLTGDFTNWEPFMIEMEEVSPGLYRASRRLAPGNYEYCFIVNGSRITDPLNPSFNTDSYGYLASTFSIQ